MKDLIKKEIIVAVIVSLLATFLIQPIFQWTWRLLISFSAVVYSGLLDQIYKRAALVVGNEIEVFSFILFWEILIIGLFFAGIQFYSNFLSTLRKRKDKEKEKDIDIENLTKDEIEREIEKLEKEIQKGVKKINRLFLVAIAVFSLVVIAIFGAIAAEYASRQLFISFNQRLTVLAVKITDQEYKEFKALWASMDSRQDYDDINNKMNVIASQQQIELPEPLLP